MHRILAGTEVHGWVSHSYGAINLFLAAGPEICARGTFEQMLLCGTYAQAVGYRHKRLNADGIANGTLCSGSKHT
jgi:hypothetical protein